MHSLLAALLLAPLALVLYFLSTFLVLIFHQARSPLRHLRGPPSPSFFVGHLREMHDQENNGLVARWTSAYGSTFVYRGFLCGRRLMTTDPLAVNHIMSRGYDYPKPDFVRDSLASMTGGYEGLLLAEGDMHRKQVSGLRAPIALFGVLQPLLVRLVIERCSAEDPGEFPFAYLFIRLYPRLPRDAHPARAPSSVATAKDEARMLPRLDGLRIEVAASHAAAYDDDPPCHGRTPPRRLCNGAAVRLETRTRDALQR